MLMLKYSSFSYKNMETLQNKLKFTTRFFKEENRKGKKFTSELPIIIGGAIVTLIGGALTYMFLGKRDQEAPQIDKLDFRDRVERGQSQSILVCAKEQNPSEYATLKLNGTSIELPLSDRSNGEVCYSSSFDPSKYFSREGAVSGQLILTDKFGNSVSKNISFLVNLEAPKIEDIKIDRLDVGKYKILADVKDENLKDVYVILDSNKIPLSQENGRFSGIIETFRDLNFTLFANDKFNMTSSYQGKIEFSKDNPNVAYALQRGLNRTYVYLIAPLDNDRIQDLNEKNFVDLIVNNSKILVVPTFSSYLEKQASDGVITDEELKYSSNFASLVNGIYGTIYDAKSLYENNGNLRIREPIKTIDYSSGLGLRLGFDKELARNATVKAIAYYGIAVIDRKLPENFDEISLLTKATQIEKYGDKLIKFSPMISYSSDGNNYVYVIDAGKSTWVLAKHLKILNDSGFDILKHPEFFYGLNRKVAGNVYSLFDADYGIKYYDYTYPTDKRAWDLMMLEWNLRVNQRERGIPWWDSDLLEKIYPDENTRDLALFHLFLLPVGTYDMESGKKVFGIEGAKIALLQAAKEYEAIKKLYPNGTVRNPIWGNVSPRWEYYSWLEDRGVNGLENTHIEYVGLKPLELWKIMTTHINDYWEYIRSYEGIDQHLSNNWKDWDWIKFAVGYEVYKPTIMEIDKINFIIPQLLQYAGYPVTFIHIEPTPKGAAYYEWAISLPTNVINSLKEKFPDAKLLIGSGNFFGLYSCGNGLEKDGIKEVYMYAPYTTQRIYLMKKP
jgi:hypothetical protein